MSEKNEWEAALKQISLRSTLRWDQSLKRYNTLRIGGTATCFADVCDIEDLAKLLSFINKYKIPWFILGKGSNLLISDEHWPGIILRLTGEFKKWHIQPEERTIDVGAALADVTFAQRCVALGWGGMEFLIGIPGSIGGAIAMNAGAHGGETSYFLKKVRWMDITGNSFSADGQSLSFEYRHSPLNGKYDIIVTEALFQLDESNAETVKSQIRKFQNFRMQRQPQKLPNCGSVFKNPPGDYAARLIEASGLKGYRIGEAQISEKHSNFIVNLGRASSTDVLSLMELAQERVLKDHGTELELEVQILKFT